MQYVGIIATPQAWWLTRSKQLYDAWDLPDGEFRDALLSAAEQAGLIIKLGPSSMSLAEAKAAARQVLGDLPAGVHAVVEKAVEATFDGVSKGSIRVFHVDDRVRLVSCDDRDAPPPGTCGTVSFIDEAGTVFVNWDNGSRLGMVQRGGDRIEPVS